MNRDLLRCVAPLVILLLYFSISSSGQKQANVWYYSDYGLNFNTTPHLIFDPAPHQARVMGVISDVDGNLLMYGDGFNIWNRFHEKMPNGSDVLPIHHSSSFQATIIIPKPEDSGIYYVLTSDPANGQPNPGLYYSVVDMSLDGGKGDVTQRAVKLADYTTNKMGAVFHKNGKDVWVMIQQELPDNDYLTYLITKNGIQTPIKNTVSTDRNSWGGQFKFAPDGSMGAVSYPDSERGFDLFDFDSSTGLVSNVRHVPISYFSAAMSFSSDATKLYISRYNGGQSVLQYDVTTKTESALRASEIDVYSIIYNGFFWFQLGPDGKIYISKGGGGGGTAHLGVINDPNAKGKAASIVENQLYLEGRESFVVWGPMFIESYFFRSDLNIENYCLGDNTEFELTNYSFAGFVEWDLGDGTSMTADSVKHKYLNSGTYHVKAEIHYGTRVETLTRTITINPLPEFTLGDDRTVCDGFVLKPDTNYESFLWSNSSTAQRISPHQSGRYNLIQTNQFGCVFSDDVNLVVNPTSFVTLANDTSICDNTSIVLKSKTKTGTPTYVWNTGSTTETITANKTGFYWLKTSNSFQCTDIDSIYIVTKPAPAVDLGNDTILYRDSYLSLNPGYFGAGSSYLWDDFSTGQTRAIFGTWYLGIRQFSLTVTASNGCEGRDDIVIEFLNVTGVEEDAKSFKVFPVPTGRELHIQMAGGNDFSVHLFDVSGRSVLQKSYHDRDIVINTATLQPGVYRLIVTRDTKVIGSKTIIRH